ncbi:MAG: DnaB-like helicase C-terminal domain-containing protein [Bacillota bacterium]|nr:DnaB-like helicase C-terminal domain-containing protein [Bacillota bacterium]
MITENLLNSINRGRAGLNVGLSTGLPKLDMLTYGIQRKWLTVIAGDTGSGKSSLALYSQVYQPFQQYMENKELKINFLIFSFEMSAEVLMAKMLCTYIYETFHKVISYEEILSLTGTLSDEDYELVLQSQPWLEEFEKHCEIIDKPVSAKALYGICKEWSRKFGTYKELEKTDDFTKEEYLPKDPKQYLIVLVDHIKLLSVSAGNTAKQEIDTACDYLIHFRNKCSFTITIVQQLNRNFKSMARRTEGGGQFNLLQLDDLSDSSGPANAAEVVIGIFHPFREKMSRCEGYDVRQLKDRIRLVQILKQRFGQADRSVGCTFFGEVNLWRNLPLPSEITDYEPLCQL